MFEIGAAFDAVHERVWQGPQDLADFATPATQAVMLYRLWCNQARRGALCWIWAGRELGIIKDVRRMIADCVWDGRAAWSERPIVVNAGRGDEGPTRR